MTMCEAAAQPTLHVRRAQLQPSSRSPTLTPVAIFIGLSLADAILSAGLLAIGMMHEANPMMRLALNHLGLMGFLFFKLAVTAGVACILVTHHRKLPRLIPRLTWSANALYLLVWGYGFAVANLGFLASSSPL